MCTKISKMRQNIFNSANDSDSILVILFLATGTQKKYSIQSWRMCNQFLRGQFLRGCPVLDLFMGRWVKKAPLWSLDEARSCGSFKGPDNLISLFLHVGAEVEGWARQGWSRGSNGAYNFAQGLTWFHLRTRKWYALEWNSNFEEQQKGGISYLVKICINTWARIKYTNLGVIHN